DSGRRGARDERPARPAAGELNFRALALELDSAQRAHQEALAAAESIFDGVRGGGPIRREIAQKVAADLSASIARSPEANLLLMQMRRFQRDLFVHAVNVCVLALVVAALEEFDFEAPAFALGALFHDIGETRIPRNLLRKQESFSESERKLLAQHPTLGALLLQTPKRCRRSRVRSCSSTTSASTAPVIPSGCAAPRFRWRARWWRSPML